MSGQGRYSAAMPIVTLHELSKAYGPQLLLEAVSLRISRHARIGLIGRNGEGKSTLLKIIAGLIEPDSGAVNLRSGVRIAYLPQAPRFEAGHTVFSVVAEGLGEVADSLNAYDEALMALESDASESAMKRLADMQSELERTGGWQYRSRIESAISRLQLDAHRDVGELSGGWLRRVALARAVVAEPDLLLLDEPTNHLDIASIEWLEDFVADFAGAVIFITHDRYFLDAVAEEVVELDRGRLTFFPCSYAEYLDKKAEHLAHEERQHRKFDKLLADEERWIRQGIPARRSRNEGRVRNLEELRRQRESRRLRGSDVELRVSSGIKPGKMLIEAVELSHSFDDTVIASNLNLKIMAGDRIGLIGPNGIGKTTLLKMLLGELKPQHGRVRHGVRLAPAFLTQMRELDPEMKIRDVLLPQGGNYVHIAGVEPRHIASYLQDFLFDTERLHSRVSALSGGERGRLMLARLLLEPANLLVLDEPTNDLDIGTLTVLEQALARYDGTVLLVSHDRAFMDRVISRVLAFEGEGKVVPIEGGWSDYTVWKSKQKLPKTDKKEKKTVQSDSKQAKKQTKLSYKDQKELDELPTKIEALELEKSEIEERFCDPDYFNRDGDAFLKDQNRLAALEAELAACYERWDELETKQTELAA
ncbi:MAG: ATP-binding cassette domain-containing protein [Mariprofundaceae bacterium]|nr:ATP-binding cassette domain-containing protein [Mariprofundaceae bacterium]